MIVILGDDGKVFAKDAFCNAAWLAKARLVRLPTAL
jgi:hypothetical protein